MIISFLKLMLAVLFILHAAWLGAFTLDLFFDTSRSTAAERARSIVRHLFYGIFLEAAIGVVVAVLVFQAISVE